MNMLFTAKALQQTYREKQVALLLAFLDIANHMIHFTDKHYGKNYWLTLLKILYWKNKL